ncbi:MAG: terminase large subunit [Oscillospiraceae bacterium]
MTTSGSLPAEIREYIQRVRSGKPAACKDQLALCDYVENCFAKENLCVDTQQLQRYLVQQKYFPFSLLPWEKFVFAIHNCTYTAAGLLRWPVLVILVGRGAGKNGYFSFESFCWLTPINGVRNYNVDIFANSEEQASTSFKDIHEMLEDNRQSMDKFFYWNKEVIRNKKTGSELKFHTAAPKTKDGGRPGAVAFDEYHGYENYKLIDVAKTGLGKKRFPRQTIITTDGYVRGGPLDNLKVQEEDILYHGQPDNGIFPFFCRLDDKKEVDDPEMWHKANPSLAYFPDLMQQMVIEYADYKINPSGNSSFMVKRMNMPMTFEEESVTDWENILAANGELPDLTGCPCVGAIDYAKTTDFVAAGALFKYNETLIWITHTWICRNSPDLPYVKAPLDDWAEMGLLTFVDAVEIPPELPVQWLQETAEKYNVTVLGLDNFRYALLRKALNDGGFDTEKGGRNNILLTKRVTQMRYVPVIASAFNTHKVLWGNNPLMNWYTQNTCVITERGNQYYGKKEEKSRKTDGFMALVSAVCASENLQDCGDYGGELNLAVYAY